MNIADAIFDHARERPDHPALEDDDRVFTYAELAALVVSVSTALRTRGIASGDFVGVALPDSIGHVAVLYALAKIGVASVAIEETELEKDKLAALCGISAKAAITRNDTVSIPGVATIPADELFRDLTGARGPKPLPAPDNDRDLTLTIAQSSGTTGEPKRLLITHNQMIGICRRLSGMLALTPADRYLHISPLRYYSARRRCMAVLTLGATMVFCPSGAVSECLQHISTRNITYVHFTATHLRALLAGVQGVTPRWPNLKMVVGAAPTTLEERRLARRRLTPRFFDVFATNEVGHLALASPMDQVTYPESVGRLVSGIDAQIVGEDGSPLPSGEIGEIGFRGEGFPQAYHDNPQATRRHFRDGWFYPGDLAALNREGYIFLKGRADDVINRAGVKYYPGEVEAVLLSHHSIRDAAVIGGPHALLGEVSVAFLVSERSVKSDEVQRFCQERIAMYKVPHYVFFVSELPRVAAGKTDKKKLRLAFQRYLETKGAVVPLAQPSNRT
jgi:acyl-CoA synthetase (AMP-forming)/AMP-acid ligase II